MSNRKTFAVDTEDNSELRSMIAHLQKVLWELEAKCQHTRCRPSDLKNPECSRPVCLDCGQQFDGWYCPASLNGQCDYQQEDGTYYDDHCIHCHQPDERK